MKKLNKKLNAIVIGAGIGGLATAIRLARKGVYVKVFEKNSRAGGKISEISDSGFRFDTGPSLFTLPELVQELFKLCNEDINEYLQYSRIDPICKYFYPDGTKFIAPADKLDFAQTLHENTNEPIENILTYLNKYEDLYNIAAPAFLYNSFHRIRNFAKPEFIKVFRQLNKLDSFTTMSERNRKMFESEHVQQLFNRYATYNGSSPYGTPATLNMISHLEHNLGGFFPAKGMYQIVDALYQLALKQGVEFSFNAEVTSVKSSGKRVTGLVVNNKLVESDIVINNGDATAFYKYLMSQAKLPKSVSKHELSSSGLIFYWGISKEFAELELHNILFSNDYKNEFETIFKKRTIFNDPTVYIFISSKLISGDAPSGKENWFVMINTPANYGQNWDELIKKVRKVIIEKINRQLNIDIEQYIEFEHIGSPLTIEQQTSSYKGALYGNSSNGVMAAFNRHANFSRIYKNLYFTGGSVHPGGGIPLCLCSAKIVSDLVTDDFLN